LWLERRNGSRKCEKCGGDINAKAGDQNPDLERFRAGCAEAWGWPATYFCCGGGYRVIAVSDFRIPAVHLESKFALFALRCFALGMRKSNQHRHNEKLRREARLQKLAKKAKKRALQGGAPAAGA
jgi:hypothetical protein